MMKQPETINGQIFSATLEVLQDAEHFSNLFEVIFTDHTVDAEALTGAHQKRRGSLAHLKTLIKALPTNDGGMA